MVLHGRPCKIWDLSIRALTALLVIIVRGETFKCRDCRGFEIVGAFGWGPGPAPIALSNHDKTLTIECIDLSAGGPLPCPHLAVLLMAEVDTCQSFKGWI